MREEFKIAVTVC